MNRFRIVSLTVLFVFILGYGTAWWASSEPELFDVKDLSVQLSPEHQQTVGYTTTSALIWVLETLLTKNAGFTSNDVMPPFSLLDNMPAWELGALEMSRDLALALRKDLSRSQSQSIENQYLKLAQPMLNIDHRSWAVPAAEAEYQQAIAQLSLYRTALLDPKKTESQFYTRADNLRDLLKNVEKRLGSYSQRLSVSVGQDRLNTDLAGDKNARQSTATAESNRIKTSWWSIDDEFYEARGACWALLHFLKAIELDFAEVLINKNAMISLRQIIRELEATQEPVWSPMILNGRGFGFMANHSLVMANYISRANAALLDLTELLAQG